VIYWQQQQLLQEISFPLCLLNLKEEEEDEAAWMFSLPGNIQ
jgi:hypothetical protein